MRQGVIDKRSGGAVKYRYMNGSARVKAEENETGIQTLSETALEGSKESLTGKAAFAQRLLVSVCIFVAVYHAVMSMLSLFSFFSDMSVFRYTELGLFAALGACAIYCLRVCRPRIRLSAEPALLAGMLVWLGVSCLVMSLRYGVNAFVFNRVQLADTAAETLVFFPLGAACGRGRARRELKAVLAAAMACWTAFVVVALIKAFTGGIIEMPGGRNVGMYNNTLWLGNHHNFSAAVEMLCFLLCVIMGIMAKKRLSRGAFLLFASVHFCALVLTNSRTALISALFGLALTLGVCVRWAYKVRKAGRGGKKRWTAAALLCVILILAAVLSRQVPFLRLDDEEFYFREIVDSTFSTLNGRTLIWSSALEGTLSDAQRVLTGVTPAGITKLISDASMGEVAHAPHAHNHFIQLLAALGVPGLCAFCVWLFLILKTGAKQALRGDRETMFILAVILSVLLSNFTEALIMFFETVNGHVFFLLCGVIYGKKLRDARSRPKEDV